MIPARLRQPHTLHYLRPRLAPLRPFHHSLQRLAQQHDPHKPSEKNPPIGGAAPTRPKNDQLSFFPFAFIFASGTGLYVLIVRSREGTTPKGYQTPWDREKGELPFKRKREYKQGQETEQ